jgi:hypothetical protein
VFATPEGVTWKVLWVPDGVYVSAAVKERLEEFAKVGGRIVYGSAEDAADGIVPDVVCGPDAQGRTISDWRKGEQPVDWLHRKDTTADWYFVAANGMDAYDGEVTFRMEGDVSVWDPVTGTRYVPDIPHVEDMSTTIKLSLAPAECVFVVFAHGGESSAPGNRVQHSAFNSRQLREWTLSFPSGWGAPESVKLDSLKSWTELPIGDEGRHFSGTATYRTTFEARKGDALTLDLGEVEVAAEVSVNGKSVRKLWAPPYRCDIGAFVKDGANELRVDVTSTWFNRLAYDEGLPEKERKTWTIAAPPKGTPPMPAGLLGPVTIQAR